MSGIDYPIINSIYCYYTKIGVNVNVQQFTRATVHYKKVYGMCMYIMYIITVHCGMEFLWLEHRCTCLLHTRGYTYEHNKSITVVRAQVYVFVAKMLHLLT